MVKYVGSDTIIQFMESSCDSPAYVLCDLRLVYISVLHLSLHKVQIMRLLQGSHEVKK